MILKTSFLLIIFKDFISKKKKKTNTSILISTWPESPKKQKGKEKRVMNQAIELLKPNSNISLSTLDSTPAQNPNHKLHHLNLKGKTVIPV